MVNAAVTARQPYQGRVKVEGLRARPCRTVLVARAADRVTDHGPYRIIGDVAIHDAEGTLLRTTGDHCLCRCGGSRNKPFCDATHGLKGFGGTESADHAPIAGRRDAYVASGGVTVYDDRSRCALFGQCTSRLPAVFRSAGEPVVDSDGASGATIAEVVAGCPCGALAYALGDAPDPVERSRAPLITPIVDGPIRIRGAIEVVGADRPPYERRERQTLCGCGQSANKPFCDRSHWYAVSATRSRPSSSGRPRRSMSGPAGSRPSSG